ncbi:E3 ubiquitin-protein ligase [Canna indica]|uniref:U-box domain-containing protein n=1 Tax=Canna indica TaxID=4628 RepID=A0AAQ3Q6E6_9LILI|nr:E3 ubiquitin-protein ligase [Canna indica]
MFHVVTAAVENSDFAAFCSCEEAHRPLRVLTLYDDDVFKSLLEVLSDEISISTKLSSSLLDVLEIVAASKKNRLKAIEAGAARVLVELLLEVNRHSCEKALLLLKRLCERAEWRRALVEHEMGVAAVSKKMLRVSEVANKLGVKILPEVATKLGVD